MKLKFDNHKSNLKAERNWWAKLHENCGHSSTALTLTERIKKYGRHARRRHYSYPSIYPIQSLNMIMAWFDFVCLLIQKLRRTLNL